MDQMSYFFKNACFQFDKENFSCVREMCKAKRDLQDLIENLFSLLHLIGKRVVMHNVGISYKAVRDLYCTQPGSDLQLIRLNLYWICIVICKVRMGN